MISHFKKLIIFYYLVLLDLLTFKQKLERVPEPAISDGAEQVDNYDKVMSTSMSAIYALCLSKISSLTESSVLTNAADFCCGPGHFTKLLFENLKIKHLYGVDLSDRMLDKLKKNNSQVFVKKDDLTQLSSFEDKDLDLAVAMNCLHHLPDLKSLKKALATLDRVTKDEGLVFIEDVCRLKTEGQTNLFTNTFGMKDVEGQEFFQKDFELSMMAAWTFDEIRSCLPQNTTKQWFVLKGSGLSTMIIIFATNKDVGLLNLKKELSKEVLEKIIPSEYRTEFLLLALSYRFAKIKKISS